MNQHIHPRHFWSFQFLALLAAGVSLSSSTSPASDAVPSKPLQQLQSHLTDDISRASIKDLEKAMRAAVVAKPESAPDYVEAFLKSRRKITCADNARIVAAAISALGKKPTAKLVADIIKRAVQLDPKCAPAIVGAAVQDVPADIAYLIVETAIASVANPEQMVGNLTLAEAILSSALSSRSDLDPGLLANAASQGLSENLSTVLADSLPSSQSRGAQDQTFSNSTTFQSNPDMRAVIIAEHQNNAPTATNP